MPLARRLLPLILVAIGAVGLGGEAPLLVFECEHAKRLRGPAWVRRDVAASRLRCVELMGERALAFVEARVPRGGVYTVWARARSARGGAAAVSLRRDEQGAAGGQGEKAEAVPEPLNAAVRGQEWRWVRLGPLDLRSGQGATRALRLVATGTLRLDQLVLAGDPEYVPQGTAESAADGGPAGRDIYFADDFMRSKREAGPWRVVSGTWVIQELQVRKGTAASGRRPYDPTRSANAFSYIGTGQPSAPAVATTGYPFWRNYSFEAAARSPAGQPFGLVFLRQDADNYYLLHCDLPRARLELVRCLDGITDRLAVCPGELRANQWYRLRVEACDGELAASIDGHVVLRAVDHTFLQGQVGIWSADEHGANFDDVLVRSWRTVAERFHEWHEWADGTSSPWDATGTWHVGGRRATGLGTLLYREALEGFEAEVEVLSGFREAGLVFDWRDAGHYAALALSAEPPRAEIREVRGGKATTLASAPLPLGSGARRVRVTQQQGRVRAWVDGHEVAGAFRPAAGPGRVGLFATGGPAGLRDVRLSPAQSPPPAVAHNRIFAGEYSMTQWARADSDWQIAEAGDRTTAWHEIEHWADCAIRYDLTDAALAGKLGLVLRADGKDPHAGYQLVAEPQAKGSAKLTLLRGKQTIGTASAAKPGLVELRWIGRCAVVAVDGKRVMWHRDPKPPTGRRAAIWTEGWKPSMARTSVGSANLVDDYFESAPVEWRTESGAWAMQNRWTCSPQWSWYGGGAPTAGMLWYKQAFRGDIAVHSFAAFKMKSRSGRIYRPSELNVTICGDGRNPFSGYTFLYGGWNNAASALFRRGKVVARTTNTSLRPPTLLDTTPDMDHLHRKWWHVAIEKRGATVRCYCDDQLALEFTDPEPLPGGSVCVWTHDNYIMIARAWMAYEGKGARDAPLAPPAEEPAPGAPPPAVAATHRVIVHDFEAGLGKWAGTPGSSTVRLAARDKGLALAVANPHAGGDFELAFPIEPFDALALPRLTFDYRVPPDVKVNLHVKMNGRQHAVLFTDAKASVAGIPVLGRVDAKADDAWHTADIDLRALLLRCYPAAVGGTLPVEAISLGTRDKHNYLTAGLGGNTAGLTYRLDNVRLWSPGPSDVTFSWDGKLAVSHVLDRTPATVPDDAPEQGAAARHKSLADGAWFFHLKARQADPPSRGRRSPAAGEVGGTWSRVAHVPIVVDASAPRVAAASPAAGTRSAAHVVTVDLADESGIDPKSLSVSLLGKAYPVQVVPTDPTASYTPQPVTFDPVARRLTADLAALPLTFDDGKPMRLTVAAAKDFLGQAMPKHELNWVFDRAGDKEPPRHLRLESSHPDLCRDDFETGLGQWAATPTYSIIERDHATAATGRTSLRIHSLYSGGPFTVTARSGSFDAGRYPIVSFDYKIPAKLRVDLVLTIHGTVYTVRFTDPNGTNCIGAIPGVQPDNEWHHTEFNLHEMLASAAPKTRSYVVSSLQFADTGYYGNADGTEYHIDNFCISPATSTRGAPLEWKLAATDPTGISAYQYSLSKGPASRKWQDSKTAAWQFRKLGAGIYHFLARARDGAGNWSEPVHRKILIDDEPPVITTVRPKPGGRSCESRIRVALADAPAGIDLAKTTLTVAGVAYTGADQGVSYNARSHSLIWNGPELAVPVTFANGRDVAVELATQDNVGNAATTKWTWKMDYALDKTPPPVPYVTRVPTKALARDTFETSVGNWNGYGKYGTVERVASTAATGRYAVRVTATRSRTYFGAYAYRSLFDAAKHPVVSFDYRIPPGVPINLLAHVGAWKTIKLTSRSATYEVVGVVPLTADNTWRHAEIDLARFLKASATKSGAIRVRYILFADFASRSVAAGTSFHIDNFAISVPESGQKLQFEWSVVKDNTGIAGYAHAFDKVPTTLPTQLGGSAITTALKSPGPGDWFFHLRARDGAGNWGPVVHFPVAIPTRTAAAK